MYDAAFNLSLFVSHMAVDPGHQSNEQAGRTPPAKTECPRSLLEIWKEAIKEKTVAKDGTRIIAQNVAGRSCVSRCRGAKRIPQTRFMELVVVPLHGVEIRPPPREERWI